MPWATTLRRLPVLLIGLWLFGVGISLMVEADLGLGPWDVFHQGVSELTGWSIGRVINLTGLVVVLGFIPLREKVGIGTVLNAVVIGVAADATSAMLPPIQNLGWRWAAMVAGPVVIAIGSGLYIGAGLGPGPRDGLMTGLARRGIDVWKARFGIELAALSIGVLLGGSVGVGTLWFAVGIGPLVQFFLTLLAVDTTPTAAHRSSPAPT